MLPCPYPETELTRYGWCHYYSFNQNRSVTIAGPQSSLTFYAAYNKSDKTTGTLEYVDGMTVFYSYGGEDKVMLEKQSTFALPGRLTKIALRPHLTKYLDGTDAKGKSYCSSKKLDFFTTYSRFDFGFIKNATFFLETNVWRSVDTK